MEQVNTPAEGAVEGTELEGANPPATSAPEREPKRHSLAFYENFYGWLYISPMIIGILVFTAIPLVMSLLAMFYNWSPAQTLLESPFVGFDNFKQIFGGGTQTTDFWRSVGNTFIFVVQLPICLILGLFLAVGMNRKMRGVQAFRVIYYLPGVMSVVAVTIIWQNLFKYDGSINNALVNMGMGRVQWLSSRGGVAFVVNLLLVWKGVGYSTLMLIAGLQSVSTDQIEAAKIDGANGWVILIKITMPALYPIMFYLLVTGLMGSIQMFNEPYILLGDGDKNGMTGVGYVYNRFKARRLGIASVCAWTIAVLTFIVTAIQLFVDKKKREAE